MFPDIYNPKLGSQTLFVEKSKGVIIQIIQHENTNNIRKSIKQVDCQIVETKIHSY